ncbi:uracil-DNA glycosylase [Clostridia bacterium]|nr:uracil-DNA glycosylase [Clostridia bacterium]
MRDNLIGNNWDSTLYSAFHTDTYLALREFLKSEYSSHTIYPKAENIFNSLKFTPPENVKAVIIGQDPYINPNQAHGLAFSVMEGTPPPSLVNIFKELSSDLAIPIPTAGCLIPWAKQGVLLLNNVLTVRAGSSNSHRGKGWEEFTNSVIKHLGERETPTVFLLWGRNAQEKEPLISGTNHLILKAPHPSPLSAHNGFFGCKHFSKTNEFLREKNIAEINWSL